MIVRAIAIKNAITTGTACACTGAGVTNPGYAEAGTVVDLGGRACDTPLYAALQIFSSVGNGIKVFLQGNSSSGFTALNAGADLVAWTSRTCRDSQWTKLGWNCASATSTNRNFYRAAWTQTCAQTQLWLAALSVGEG